MNGTLVIGDIEAGGLSDASLRLVSAAGGPVTLGLVVKDEARAREVGAAAGVVRVLAVGVDETFDTDRTSAAVRTLIERTQPQLVLMPYAIRPASIGAAIAKKSLDLGFVSDVVRVASAEDGAILATRSVYGGKAFPNSKLPPAHLRCCFCARTPGPRRRARKPARSRLSRPRRSRPSGCATASS